MYIYKTFQPKIISTKPRINKLLVAKILYFFIQYEVKLTYAKQ